jgi:uncharacterized membrane protein
VDGEDWESEMQAVFTGRSIHAAAIVWFGVMAGFFWSFSVVVMPGLNDADPLAAMRSMQAINDGVQNMMFAIGFFGAPLLCILMVLHSIARFQGIPSAMILGASIVYLLGVFSVTFLFNVPLNQDLAAVDASSASNATLMVDYIEDWTIWNHVRTGASLLSLFLLGGALMISRSSDAHHDQTS